MADKLVPLQFDNDLPELNFTAPTQVAPQEAFRKFRGAGGIERQAVRAAIPYVRGAIAGRPPGEKIDSFMAESQKSAVFGKPPRNLAQGAVEFGAGLTRDMAGMAADIATDPEALAIGMATGQPGTKAALSAAGKTKVAQAVLRFLQKPHYLFKFGKRTLQRIAEKAGRGVKASSKAASDQYEAGLKGIKGSVDKTEINQIIKTVDNVKAQYPEEAFTNLTKIKTHLLKKDTVSANGLHALKQELKKGINKSVFKGSASPDALQAARLQVYNKVDDVLVGLGDKTAPGKYTAMKAEYRSFSNMVRDVNRAILEDGRPGTQILRQDAPTISKLFDPNRGLTVRQTDAMKKLSGQLPPKEQFMQDFAAWKRGILLRDVGMGVGGAGLLYGLRRRVGKTVIPESGGGG